MQPSFSNYVSSVKIYTRNIEEYKDLDIGREEEDDEWYRKNGTSYRREDKLYEYHILGKTFERLSNVTALTFDECPFPSHDKDMNSFWDDLRARQLFFGNNYLLGVNKPQKL